jgi:hypothetical protein
MHRIRSLQATCTYLEMFYGKIMLDTNPFVLVLIAITLVSTVPLVLRWINKQKDELTYPGEMGSYAIQAEKLIKMTEESGAQRAALLAKCAHMLTENPPVSPESTRNVAFHVIARVSASDYEAGGKPLPKLGDEMNAAVGEMVNRIVTAEQDAATISTIEVYSDKSDRMSLVAKEFITELQPDAVTSAVLKATYNWIKEQESDSPDSSIQAFREFVIWWGGLITKGTDAFEMIDRSRYISGFIQSYLNDEEMMSTLEIMVEDIAHDV